MLLKRNATQGWKGKNVDNKEIIRRNKNIELKELGSFLLQVKVFIQCKMQVGKYSDSNGANLEELREEKL
jgi:hypothetical protein